MSEPNKESKPDVSNFASVNVEKWIPLPPPNMELLTRKPVIMLKWENTDSDSEDEIPNLKQVQDLQLDNDINTDPTVLKLERDKDTEVLDLTTPPPPPVQNRTESGSVMELFGEREFDSLYTSMDNFLEMSSSSDEELPSVSWMKPQSKKAKIERCFDNEATSYKTKPPDSNTTVKSVGDNSTLGASKPSNFVYSQPPNESNSISSAPSSDYRMQLSNLKSDPSTDSVFQTVKGGNLVTESCPLCNMRFPSR